MRLPIGISDFAIVREDGFEYVDKTSFIADVVRAPSQALLLPRPRRFGKTLNLSALRYFLERSDRDRTALFEGLDVARAGDDVAEHFQRHPVLFLTLKDLKAKDWSDCISGLRNAMRRLVLAHRETIEPVLATAERAVVDGWLAPDAEPVQLAEVLRELSRWLHLATGEKVAILIDEYDTPIHAGYARGYYDDVISFFRDFLSGGLKDNPHLYRGVVTGILRVAKESIFSGLNNLDVYTLTSERFSTAFGFTEAEVEHLAVKAGLQEHLDGLRSWYDGYRFGRSTIYNPWSIVSFLSKPGDGLRAYWVQTASNEILRDLLTRGGLGLHDDMAALIRGEQIEKRTDEHLVLRDLELDAEAVWTFLLFSGYLRWDGPGDDGRTRLSIPNREVRGEYEAVFSQWLRRGLGGSDQAVEALCTALLTGNAAEAERYLGSLFANTMSYHDLRTAPEAVYQAFIVGLLLHVRATHEVTSNRESGFGRYNVMLAPRTPGRAGVVLELKIVDTERGETPPQALEAALLQIADRQYAAALRERGADPRARARRRVRGQALLDGRWRRGVVPLRGLPVFPPSRSRAVAAARRGGCGYLSAPIVALPTGPPASSGRCRARATARRA